MGLVAVEDDMMANATYAASVRAKRWSAAASIGGVTEHAVRMRHDDAYRTDIDRWRQNSDRAGDIGATVLTAHGRRSIDTSFAAAVRTRIAVITINGRAVSQWYIARCVGCHVESLRALMEGYFQGTDGLRQRIDDVLTRLEAGEIIVPGCRISEDESAWVDMVKASLKARNATIADLAVAVGKRSTVYNITAKYWPASPELKARIEAELVRIKGRAA